LKKANSAQIPEFVSIGVGGGGGNAVEHMIKSGVRGAGDLFALIPMRKHRQCQFCTPV
jgi:cell division GTPase FtsZ